ncbi:hypothetical protein GDO78_011923 [Eleutherodactylus coqui]|uniref:Uncharacterized protein n=1 Tax=Eleutherodactylus coqui TaxID=57060 RepID=A0A8J6F401_ELECQ|nr:hypothetical protein GDO78_011923 [Eleutherodactylus coqui]
MTPVLRPTVNKRPTVFPSHFTETMKYSTAVSELRALDASRDRTFVPTGSPSFKIVIYFGWEKTGPSVPWIIMVNSVVVLFLSSPKSVAATIRLYIRCDGTIAEATLKSPL